MFPALAREVGANVVMLRGCYPVGRASETGDLCPSLAEYEDAISRLKSTGRCVTIVPNGCEAGPLEDVAVIHDNFGCAAGNSVASVSSNGDVSPCSLIGGVVELDNLSDRGFTEIWDRGRGFKKIRALEAPPLCSACQYYPTCSGGCRARAWALHGDIEAPDEWCKASIPIPA
jgi:radical SAM protein with 4Fe4S-binding SPASM domain